MKRFLLVQLLVYELDITQIILTIIAGLLCSCKQLIII